MEPWRKNLYVMVLVQFIMMLVFTAVNPFLPHFVAELGITDERQLVIWAGVLSAANPFFTAVFSPVWGSLADRYGRKVMVVRSAFSIALFTFLTSFTVNVYQVLVLRILMGVFAGFSAAAVTLVASESPSERLGYSLGLLQTGQVLGLVVGPLVGGILADLTSYRHVFRISGLIALGAGLLAAFLVRENNFRPQTAGGRRGLLRGFSPAWPLKSIGAMAAVLFVTQFSIRAVEPIIPVYVEMLGTNPSYLATITGTVFAATGLSSAAATLVVGHFSDRWGYRRTLLAGLVGTAILYGPQSLVVNAGQLLSVRLALGFFMGGILPMANALIGTLAPEDARGRVFGLSSAASFLGNSLGPMTGGLLSALLGVRATFWVTSALLLVNALWVLRSVPAQRAGVASSPCSPGGRQA